MGQDFLDRQQLCNDRWSAVGKPWTTFLDHLVPSPREERRYKIQGAETAII